MTIDEAELAARDVAAAFVAHAGALRSFALHATGDAAQAEDVVQEVMLRAWSHPGALRPAAGSARAWLFAVARNVIIDQYRRRQARPPEAPLVAEPGHLDETAADRLDGLLDAWVLADGMRELSAEHREVLVELYLRDRTVAQAAQTLGVPVGTVKSRAHHAVRALRAILEPPAGAARAPRRLVRRAGRTP